MQKNTTEIIQKTLKTAEIGFKSYYLDLLKNGKYAVSQDENILKTFDTKEKANIYFIAIISPV